MELAFLTRMKIRFRKHYFVYNLLNVYTLITTELKSFTKKNLNVFNL